MSKGTRRGGRKEERGKGEKGRETKQEEVEKDKEKGGKERERGRREREACIQQCVLNTPTRHVAMTEHSLCSYQLSFRPNKPT